jgi:hypothetical protein
MLSWHKTKPGGKVACLAERLGRRSQHRYSRGDEWPYSRHCHEPQGHPVCLRPPVGLGIELADLGLQMAQRRNLDFERSDGVGRRAAGRLLDEGDQLRGIRRPLRDDLSELRQMAAQGVDRLRALLDQKLPDPKTMAAPCVSSVFTGTKRIDGRMTALQIASGSAASFFWRLTNGFT